MHNTKILFVTVVCSLCTAATEATHPVFLSSWRFVSSESVVGISGGFAGFNLEYRVRGDYDLTLDLFPHEADAPNAKFADVNAHLVGPPPFAGEDLNAFFNLTSLEGFIQDTLDSVTSDAAINEPLSIVFEGSDRQGVPLRIETLITDNLMFLRGRNRIEDTCCDLFGLKIDAIARRIPSPFDADFDEDGDVDGNDFLLWQVGFPTRQGAMRSDGDADGDQDVDGIDFLVWQRQFNPGDVSGGGGSTVSIPEPAAVSLWMLLVVGTAAQRRLRSVTR